MQSVGWVLRQPGVSTPNGSPSVLWLSVVAASWIWMIRKLSLRGSVQRRLSGSAVTPSRSWGPAPAGTQGSVGKQRLERLERLLDHRPAAVRASEHVPSDSDERTGFGCRFAYRKSDDAWAVSRLEEVLKLTGSVDRDCKALERLAELSSAAPACAIRHLRLVAEGGKEGWRGRIWQRHECVILGTGVRSRDAKVRRSVAPSPWPSSSTSACDRGFLSPRERRGRWKRLPRGQDVSW